LSMLSPVWREKLGDEFVAEEGRILIFEEEDESFFSKSIALACGKSVTMSRGLDELIGLLRMADRHKVEAIQSYLEEAVMDRLTVESCGPVLTMTRGSGLVRLEGASRELALREFDRFAECAGFMDVSEEVLGSLLESDALESESEERVLKCAVRWMKGGAGGAARGEGLLRKIRFPSMPAEFLADEARGMLPESEQLEGLVLESGLLKSMAASLWAGKARTLRHLDPAVLAPRLRRGVDWAEYAGGGGRRLAAGQWAFSVAAHGRGFVCGGLQDGSIRVWNRATLEVERTLAGHTGKVWALVSVEGRLVSGSDDGVIRVWDVVTGRCEGTLEGHTHRVRCLAVSGHRLVSGSWDGTARVWAMEGAAAAWRCERTLAGHGGGLCCVAAWGGRVASGSADTTVRVWDAATGAHAQTLRGHEGSVRALAACGQRLISASEDRTVRAWSTATWACVQTVPAYPAGAAQYIGRLAVSGPTLVGGSLSRLHSLTQAYEVRVWDLETLQPLHALRQPAGQCVAGLAGDGGEVWAAVGQDVVVWGRRG
jgi:hypothetical protein